MNEKILNVLGEWWLLVHAIWLAWGGVGIEMMMSFERQSERVETEKSMENRDYVHNSWLEKNKGGKGLDAKLHDKQK